MNVTIYNSIEKRLNTDDAKNALRIIMENNIDGNLKHFKEFLKHVEKNGDDNSLQDLISMFYLLESKHPVKSLIQTYFNQKCNNKEEVVRIFADLLKDQVNELKDENYAIENNYKFVNYLNELSQNFEIAGMTVGSSSEIILSYLNATIAFLLEQLNLDLSHSKKSGISHNLHNCLQAYIFCVRSCIQQEKVNAKFIIQCDELLKTCDGFFENNDIGMETKNIFSMLTVIGNNLKKETSHLETIMNEKESIEKRLCLMFGMIQIANYENIDEIEIFCNILNLIYISNSVDNAVVYSIARLLMQITKKLSTIQNLKYSEQTKSITTFIIIIALWNLEHSVESIRYLSKETIKCCVELGAKIHDGQYLIEDFFLKTTSLSTEQKAIIMNSIQSVFSIKIILQRFPDILALLISSININKEGKINSYVTLSKKGRSELGFGEWYEIFIRMIEEKIQDNEETTKEDILCIRNLLLKCIRKDVEAIEMILIHRNAFDKRFNFMLLNLAKEEGILDNTLKSESSWKGIVSYDEIENAMIDIDIDIRLSAIHLIVNTSKISDEFTNIEIECIFKFFENNINIQIPSTRQVLVGVIKKIFARIHCAIKNHMRKNDICLIKNQFEILLSFHKFSIQNLINSANYSRRNLSLVILLNVHEIIQEFFPDERMNIWDKTSFDSLFDIYYDPYERNKEMALEIMSKLPTCVIKRYSNLTLDSLEKLHQSIKPADSQTASYLLLFSMRLPAISADLDSFKILIWCEKGLTNALERAEKSIIVAAGSNPIYGFISSIRLIISKLDFNGIIDCAEWREFFVRLVAIAKRLITVAAPIVNDPSPEGVFPTEDFNLLLQNETEKDIRNIIENTTSQMILLCAWRIIKEVSLLLGDISQKAVKISNINRELLTSNQLLNIGKEFIELLTNIKHRGAFEQCYTGFSQYCYALRMSNCQELHNMPMIILQNILDSMSKDSQNSQDVNSLRIENLCATRRSAGLPFIIQALLSSEAKISRTHNFHYAITNLLKFAQFGKELEIRIHSLNILRVLYRCKELNDVINQYVSEGIQCSILGCGSETWAERNSSTLLFSALMIRTFGVQRNKDCEQIDIKNKISSKIFFLRYPELYDFFMEQFIQSSKSVRKQQINPKLYPLLLILNRLFTTALENCESNMRLTNFVSIVSSCSGCVELRARILCAKFIANVVPSNALVSMADNNISVLRENLNLITNIKHGLLLQILHIFKNISKSQCENNLKHMIRIVDELLDITNSMKQAGVCLTTLLDIIIQIFQVLWKSEFKSLFYDQHKLKKCIQFDENSYYGISNMQSQVIIIELICMQFEEKFDMLECLHENSLNFYDLLKKLNCIILFLSDKKQRKNIIEEYEIDSRIHFFIDNFSNHLSNKLVKQLKHNDEFINKIIYLTKHHDLIIQARSYEILSLLNCIAIKDNEIEINMLLNNAVNKSDDFKIAILKYTRSWVERNDAKINNIDWKTISEFIHSSYWVKLALVDVLKGSGRYLEKASQKAVFYYTLILVNLLTSDDVADETSNVVSEIIGNDQIYISSYALILFVKFLMEKLKFQLQEKFSMLILVLFYKEASSNEVIDEDEFQVFDKSESKNDALEMYVIKNIIISSLKLESSRCKFSFNLNEMNSMILNFCKEIEEPVDCIRLFEFLNEKDLFD